MLRSDFDTHPLWDVLLMIDDQLDTIVADHQTAETANVERIKVQMAYVRSFDVVASTRAAFFHPAMLDGVKGVWDQVHSSLATRVANGVGYANYIQQAADQAETALLQMAAWPRPYGKGGEVKQMDTLFERLLEAQRTSIEALEAEHQQLRSEIESYSTDVEGKRDEVRGELETAQSELSTLTTTVEDQKTIVESAVEDAENAVALLATEDTKRFETWRNERESAYESDVEDLRQRITARVEAADAEYVELLTAKASYQKLVSAIAADEVAERFEKEARWGRRAGLALYGLGFALLVGAAVPLLFLLFDDDLNSSAGFDWNKVVTRLAIAAIAGSAATVAIRLGARLISTANAAKRMELELKAIGPFLANVQDPGKVDDARIQLVSRAFGKAQGDSGHSTTKQDSDEVPVTTAAQILDIAEKLAKFAPSSPTP